MYKVIFLLLIAAAPAFAGTTIRDGDTIVADHTPIRLNGVDAPMAGFYAAVDTGSRFQRVEASGRVWGGVCRVKTP